MLITSIIIDRRFNCHSITNLTCPLWETREVDLSVNSKEGLLFTIQKGTKTAASVGRDTLINFAASSLSITIFLFCSDNDSWTSSAGNLTLADLCGIVMQGIRLLSFRLK